MASTDKQAWVNDALSNARDHIEQLAMQAGEDLSPSEARAILEQSVQKGFPHKPTEDAFERFVAERGE